MNNGVKPAILHLDQRLSYTSKIFSFYLVSNGVKHSMSRPGAHGDNSSIEGFWSQMKIELFSFRHTLNRTQMIQLIEKYINWYNYKCRQETLNDVTPKELRKHAILETA